ALFSHPRGAGARLQAGAVQLQREGRTLRGVPRRRPDQDRDALPAGRVRAVEQCHGRRYNRETLDVRFKGKTIADVLEMPVEEALDFFRHIPKIKRRLQALHDVGLDYIRLGQPATTLSGGEAQRVKLATELQKIATGRTLYILDEPTTGLHFADVERLLEMLQRLVDSGNTVVVIEHNLDVIKTADHIIDLGPEGGEEGGKLVATAPPEKVAAVAGSYTGRFLSGIVEPPPARRRRPTGRSKLPAAA